MFKKSLLVLALASTTMFANAASNEIKTGLGTKGVTPKGISAQSLNVAGTVAAPTVKVVLDADYDSVLLAGAKMVITIGGANFNSGITADLTGAVLASADDPVNAGNTLTYTLTKPGGNVIDGTEITIPSLPVILTAGSKAITYQVSFTTDSGAPLASSDTAKVTVASIVDEWSAKISKLDAEIDVANKRQTFTNKAVTDTFKLDFSDVDTSAGGAGITSVQVAVEGDFSAVAKVSDGTNDYAINSAKTAATYTYAPGSTTDLSSYDKDITLTLVSGDDAVTQAERGYKATVDVKYGANKTFSVLASADVGTWYFNGTSTTMDYVPMGPNTQLIVNATSTFGEDAAVDVSYLASTGKMVNLPDVATVTANGVTKLGDKISEAILADMGTTSAKTKVTVTINAPDGEITFFAGFTNKSDGSRMGLIQVDKVANATKSAAEANKATLEDTAKGLVKTFDAVSTSAIQAKSVNVAAANEAAAVAIEATSAVASDIVCGLNASNTDAATALLVKYKASTDKCVVVGDDD